MRAFRAEWPKLLRPGHLLGALGTMVGIAVLLTFVFFAVFTSDLGTPTEEPASAEMPQVALEDAEGIVFSFGIISGLLCIVALVVAAASVATEYSAGTLKMMFVRDPRRMAVLGGKLLAIETFVLVALTITLLVSVLASMAFAGAYGVDTREWWTSAGGRELGQALLHVGLASIGWVLLGAMLSTLFRNAAVAIGIGIGFPLLVEGILAFAVPEVAIWLPGSVLDEFMSGPHAAVVTDGSRVGYAVAGGLSVAYALAFLVTTLWLTQRRDVT